MKKNTHMWNAALLLLSPREQKQWWLAELKRREPYGMAVNCKYMPSLERTPILKKLIEDGLVVKVREYNGGCCKRTVLYLSTYKPPLPEQQE